MSAPPATAPVVEVVGLVKRYGGRNVVDGLDLTVGRGEIMALLGPNGAGKTTTVETVEGYRRPDGGSVRVFGLDPRRDGGRIRPRCGVMLQGAELWNQVRVLEAVRLFAAFYATPLNPAEVLQQVGLSERQGARYRTLSGGERQRLSLALALVGRPQLAILDEPTAAMDVTARRATWALLRGLRDGGATILLTTHLIDEAEVLADRVAIMARGRLLAVGTPGELRDEPVAAPGTAEALHHMELVLRVPLTAAAQADLARLPSVAAAGAMTAVPRRPGAYRLATRDPGITLREVTAWLDARDLVPESLRFATTSLEEVFLRLTGDAGTTSSDDAPEPVA